MRAVRLVDQIAAVHGTVEDHVLPPWRGQRFVVTPHALPGGARQRRLDQGIGEIAEQALVVGELELGGLHADAAGDFLAHPAVHVVAAQIIAGAEEVAAAAAAKQRTRQDKGDRRE